MIIAYRPPPRRAERVTLGARLTDHGLALAARVRGTDTPFGFKVAPSAPDGECRGSAGVSTDSGPVRLQVGGGASAPAASTPASAPAGRSGPGYAHAGVVLEVSLARTAVPAGGSVAVTVRCTERMTRRPEAGLVSGGDRSGRELRGWATITVQ